ncbi:condensation domain-containing protein, partial [Paracidovorax cattleyae]|uniref:condensation domain-containing protein n=1 Tax=Paracidovorax cattleyae TaxID=80868 RepID=UPI001E441A41
LDWAQVEDLYPLSPLQAGLVFQTLLDPDAAAYRNQLRIDFRHLDTDRLHAAWEAAFERHAVLRSGVLSQGARPLQWVARAGRLPWREIDARGDVRDARDMRALLDAVAQEELAAGFPGMQPPLIRFALVRTGEHGHHFIWTMHHVLLDGWSTSQLMAEVLRHYAGEPDAAPAGRYRNYIRWLQHRDAEADRAWWTGALGDVEEPTLLARCLPRPAPSAPSVRDGGSARPDAGQVQKSFTQEETARLQGFVRRERITLNTLVQAAWALVLQRHAGQETVVFGTTVAGRPAELPGAERAVGLFINTLPMACTPRSGTAVGEWLRELQAQGLHMREHEHTPLYDIQRWMGTDAAGLFDTLLVFENYPVDGALHALPAGLEAEVAAQREETHYPVTLLALLEPVLTLQLRHDPGRVDAAAAGMLADQLVRGLRALAEDAGRVLGSLDVLALPDALQAPAPVQWTATTRSTACS